MSATYIYCAVRARPKPRLGRPPAGLPGLGKQRLLDAGDDLWLVAADAPLSRYGEASIQRGLHDMKWLSRCAVGHEAVVEHWLCEPAVVPMKLFTIFENDFRAVTEIGRRRAEVDRSLTRVAGRREWGVRIRMVPASAADAAGKRARTAAARARTGASYLAAKREVRDSARELAALAQARVSDAFATLAALSVDAQRHPPPAGGAQNTRLLLDAAFLVAISGTPRFRQAAQRLARGLGKDGYGVEVTGPWPPYNFIEP
jgi:hypothetical protein